MADGNEELVHEKTGEQYLHRSITRVMHICGVDTLPDQNRNTRQVLCESGRRCSNFRLSMHAE